MLSSACVLSIIIPVLCRFSERKREYSQLRLYLSNQRSASQTVFQILAVAPMYPNFVMKNRSRVHSPPTHQISTYGSSVYTTVPLSAYITQ
jgi:hypothetical protein